MVLQRVETQASEAHDDKEIDVYELRIDPDGLPVCHQERALFEEIMRRPAYRKAIKRMARPVATLLEDEDGLLTLRVSTPRVGHPGTDLIEL